MSYIDESLAKGLANRITRGFKHRASSEEFTALGGYKRKKQARELVKLCKRYNKLSFLEQRFPESSKSEVIWGEWSLSTKQATIVEENDYDLIGFDLVVDLPDSQRDKFFYLHLSKHALIRLIMRSNTKLKNATDLRLFMDGLCKRLILSCLELWSQSTCETNQNEGYIVIEGLFIPLIMELGLNKRLEESRSFTIKTVMPSDYSGAEHAIRTQAPLKPKKSCFDYAHLLGVK